MAGEAPDPLILLQVEIDRLRADWTRDRTQLGRVNHYQHIPIFSAHLEQDWRSWLYDFELVASAENWTDAMKFQKIPIFLQGMACDIYSQLTAEVRENWADLKAELTTQFYTTEKLRDNFRSLLQRKQFPSETVAKYG